MFVQWRLATPIGDPGCLSLYNADSSPQQEHQWLAEHLTSEFRVNTAGRWRTVEEWKLRLGGLDNRWLDCLVGCAVGAIMNGAVLHGTDEPERPRVKVLFSEGQRLAQHSRGEGGNMLGTNQIGSYQINEYRTQQPRRTPAGLQRSELKWRGNRVRKHRIRGAPRALQP